MSHTAGLLLGRNYAAISVSAFNFLSDSLLNAFPFFIHIAVCKKHSKHANLHIHALLYTIIKSSHGKSTRRSQTRRVQGHCNNHL